MLKAVEFTRSKDKRKQNVAGEEGAQLALEEGQLALETLFRRMPNLRFDPGRPIVWYRNAANPRTRKSPSPIRRVGCLTGDLRF